MTDSDSSLRITHRHIEVFRAVMTAGSVTGAAQLLYTSQPTVSRELARMEQLLWVMPCLNGCRAACEPMRGPCCCGMRCNAAGEGLSG